MKLRCSPLHAAIAAFLVASSSAQTLTGGQRCLTSTYCINAIVGQEPGKVTFQLQSTFGFTRLGWMAIGFGEQMPNSPMVITWPNNDGTITISQRQATAHVMPQVVPNPAQVAELAWQNSILATNSTTIAFTHPIPTNGNLNAVPMIWAYALVRPASSSPDAILQQHAAMGTFEFDLTQAMNALPTGTVVAPSTTRYGPVVSATYRPPGATTGPTQDLSNLPLSDDQKKIRTHGILMSIGFLVMLPLGVFIARFSRTIPALQGRWFTAHWFVQFVISGPIIYAGWAEGYRHVQRNGGDHFRDKHTRIGLALLILYLVQVAWGVIIHFFKPAAKPLPPLASSSDTEKSHHVAEPSSSSAPAPRGSPRSSTTGQPLAPQASTASSSSSIKHGILGRPLQNYGHALNGLAIIALAFANVREGYRVEWEYVFGFSYRSYTWSRSLNAWWISWVVIVPVLYVLGLTLLPRQWRQETARRRAMSTRS